LPPKHKRSRAIRRRQAEKKEKLSMLLCFPDGNVALHKVWARASLIIASPLSCCKEPKNKLRQRKSLRFLSLFVPGLFGPKES
jgi:hypothetical protein